MDRRQFLETYAGFVAALSTACASQRTPVGGRRSQIERLMSQLHERHLFTGEILVAEKGNVVYESAFGLANRSTGRPYTTETRAEALQPAKK